MKKKQVLSDELSPLEIAAETRVLDNNDWKKAVEILVGNSNQRKVAENVSVRILTIEPLLARRVNDRINTENSGMLPVICLSEYTPGNLINAGATARYEILSVAVAGLQQRIGLANASRIIAAIPSGNDGSDFLFCSPPLAVGESKDHILTIEVTAKDRARTEARFRLTLTARDDGRCFTLTQIQP